MMELKTDSEPIENTIILRRPIGHLLVVGGYVISLAAPIVLLVWGGVLWQAQSSDVSSLFRLILVGLCLLVIPALFASFNHSFAPMCFDQIAWDNEEIIFRNANGEKIRYSLESFKENTKVFEDKICFLKEKDAFHISGDSFWSDEDVEKLLPLSGPVVHFSKGMKDGFQLSLFALVVPLVSAGIGFIILRSVSKNEVAFQILIAGVLYALLMLVITFYGYLAQRNGRLIAATKEVPLNDKNGD